MQYPKGGLPGWLRASPVMRVNPSLKVHKLDVISFASSPTGFHILVIQAQD